MDTSDQPNARHEHVYAIVRLSIPIGEQRPEDDVVITKVFCTEAAAEAEAARLKKINSDEGCRYVVRIGRLVAP